MCRARQDAKAGVSYSVDLAEPGWLLPDKASGRLSGPQGISGIRMLGLSGNGEGQPQFNAK